MATAWEKLGSAIIASPDIPEGSKPLALAIVTGESGRRVTWVAKNLLNWWHTYPAAQITALKQFLPVLAGAAPRPPVICGHDDVEPQKVDPGPAFPWDLIRS